MEGFAFLVSNRTEGWKVACQRGVPCFYFDDEQGSPILGNNIGLAPARAPVCIDDREPAADEVPPSDVLAPATYPFVTVNVEVLRYPSSEGAIART